MTRDDGGAVALILITTPDVEVGERVGRALVDERLAACVNIVPGITSLYRWEGAVEKAGEVLLIVKSTVDALERLKERVTEIHPYDVPEIIDIPVRGGEARYLAWVRAGVGLEE